MINANELRIGNWVQCDIWNDGAIDLLKVETISKGGIYAEGHEGVFGDLQGIPLTPEILQAVGFVEIDGIPNEYFKSLYSVRKQKENGHYNNYGFYIHWDNSFTLLARVSYLHSLMNLFFALTNQELTYQIK